MKGNLYQHFKNSLIIHEENTKKNHKRVVSLYKDKDFPSFTQTLTLIFSANTKLFWKIISPMQ